MRRADRLLQIVQILRRRGMPTTAKALADELEVVPRTIYRDVAALQASRVPIEGEAGIGYVLRPGYDLPPMMFNAEEIEALVLGLRMVIERGDRDLARGGNDALAKIQAVVSRGIVDQMEKAALLVPHPLETGVDFGEYVSAVRAAIRNSRKLRIAYSDGGDRITERTIWPLGLYLFSHVTIVCAWCEQRQDYRAFRSERVRQCEPLDERFDGKNGAMMSAFLLAFAQH